MLRLAFDFIITWRETRTRPNAYVTSIFGNQVLYFIFRYSDRVHIHGMYFN